MAVGTPEDGGLIDQREFGRGALRETGIAARVLAALRAVHGPDVPITPDTLAPIDHFHRRGVVETEELAAALQQPRASDHLLDIGCGIGGPAPRQIRVPRHRSGPDTGVLRSGARAQPP